MSFQKVGTMSSRVLTALPVFNEQQHVEKVLGCVKQHAQDVLVVDDGSTDKTAEILRNQTGIHIVTHSMNQGYGAALRSAFSFAQRGGYDILVTIDCDGQHEPQRIPEFVSACEDAADGKPVDIVSGSRYLKSFSGDGVPPEERRSINMQLTREINQRLNLDLTDAFCGFKSYRVSSLPSLKTVENGYAMPLEIWVRASAAAMKIVEIPVPLVYLAEKRSFGGSLDDGHTRLEYYHQVLGKSLQAVAYESGNQTPAPLCGESSE